MALTTPQWLAETQALQLEAHAEWCLEQAADIRRRALLKNSGLKIVREEKSNAEPTD